MNQARYGGKKKSVDISVHFLFELELPEQAPLIEYIMPIDVDKI
jgi:hypothetical protein